MSCLAEENLRLSQIEYLLGRIHLRSRPRCLGLVLSNRCNIGCIHCYQAKNGDSLLSPPNIGSALRREFASLYPYLSTLRLQGGELFVIPGFRELLDDVEASVDRPLVSISTNGTLIDEAWAERIVRLPMLNVTVSIDAGTPETFAKLRKGARLETVLKAIERIQQAKARLNSPYPVLDSFFVLMRSNFRELPAYFSLMREAGIVEIAIQTVQTNPENVARVPTLVDDQVIASRAEVVALHALLRETLERERARFRTIRVSGLTTLFDQFGLDSDFLLEQQDGLYPDSGDLQNGGQGFELCPNPWTTLFVTENGNVHLCFLSEPVGNLYEEPIEAIWNSPRALAKRSRMIAGRYTESGCSTQWCSWRDGKTAAELPRNRARELMSEMKEIASRALTSPPEAAIDSDVGAVRRMLLSRRTRIAELENMFQQLCETNLAAHQEGQAYIDHLTAELTDARAEIQRLRARRWWRRT